MPTRRRVRVQTSRVGSFDAGRVIGGCDNWRPLSRFQEMRHAPGGPSMTTPSLRSFCVEGLGYADSPELHGPLQLIALDSSFVYRDPFSLLILYLQFEREFLSVNLPITNLD